MKTKKAQPCSMHSMEMDFTELRKQHNAERIMWPFEVVTITKVLQESETKRGQHLELLMVDTRSKAGNMAIICTHCEIWLDGQGYHYLPPSTSIEFIAAAWKAAQNEDSLYLNTFKK